MEEVPEDTNPEPRQWDSFIADSPPGTHSEVVQALAHYGSPPYILTPELTLYCDSELCKGDRIFEGSRSRNQAGDGFTNVFLTYKCKNCGQSQKIYALTIAYDSEGEGVEVAAYKHGEFPPMHLTVPSRTFKLVGPDRDLFLDGKRCEAQGLGIGAFAYYRRVIENQKNRLFDQIIEAARRVGYKPEQISQLESARDETQFTKSVTELKGIIPDSLLIQGHSPMLLLHRALSAGLHAKTDDECLELARTIRLVLTELASRLQELLRDHRELESAITRLMVAPSEQRLLTDGAEE